MFVSTLTIPTWYYQQFDADYSRAVPAEGYGGWQKADLEISVDHTAIAIMHAWDCGAREQFPGWYRAVEYIPRAQEISRTVFPRLLTAVRQSAVKLVHIAGAGYADSYPGYQRMAALAGPEPVAAAPVNSDAVLDRLRDFRAGHVFVGRHNEDDVNRGFKATGFDPYARPVGDEWIACTTHQLLAWCKHTGVNHIIYAGFAINWCLLLSPGGMKGMAGYHVMCSAIRQAVTAVECKESARREEHKEEGLWRTALAFGFVYDLDDLVAALALAPRMADVEMFT
jgi:hypothetical protein